MSLNVDSVQNGGVQVGAVVSSLIMLILLLVFFGSVIALIIAIIRWLNRKDRK